MLNVTPHLLYLRKNSCNRMRFYRILVTAPFLFSEKDFYHTRTNKSSFQCQSGTLRHRTAELFKLFAITLRTGRIHPAGNQTILSIGQQYHIYSPVQTTGLKICSAIWQNSFPPGFGRRCPHNRKRKATAFPLPCVLLRSYVVTNFQPYLPVTGI